MRDILKDELERISFSRNEILKFRSIANDLVKKLKEKGFKAVIGGSMAKGTMIRKEGFQDVDIFVVFDYSEDILKLEGVLKKIDLLGELKKVHGSRDYFHVVCDDVILEVVPVVKNRDPELAENVTDVSLSHVKYVGGEIKKSPGLDDEIRLAKSFVRAQRCYGAEGYIRGFSGYSLEILVIYFGGFVKFLKGIRKKQVIDPMKYFRGEREIMRELNSNKLQGPVVLIDPTYKYRNVSAGLSLSTFERFLEISQDFLEKPSSEFFERREIDLDELRKFADKKKARFLELGLSTDRQEGDIAGTKMRKIFSFFVRELRRKGQVVLRFEFDYSGEGQNAKGYLIVKENLVVERRGPSVGSEEQALAFRKAKKLDIGNKKLDEVVFKRKGFWWCREKVSVEGVLEFVKKAGGEMGAEVRLRQEIRG